MKRKLDERVPHEEDEYPTKEGEAIILCTGHYTGLRHVVYPAELQLIYQQALTIALCFNSFGIPPDLLKPLLTYRILVVSAGLKDDGSTYIYNQLEEISAAELCINLLFQTT